MLSNNRNKCHVSSQLIHLRALDGICHSHHTPRMINIWEPFVSWPWLTTAHGKLKKGFSKAAEPTNLPGKGLSLSMTHWMLWKALISASALHRFQKIHRFFQRPGMPFLGCQWLPWLFGGANAATTCVMPQTFAKLIRNTRDPCADCIAVVELSMQFV